MENDLFILGRAVGLTNYIFILTALKLLFSIVTCGLKEPDRAFVDLNRSIQRSRVREQTIGHGLVGARAHKHKHYHTTIGTTTTTAKPLPSSPKCMESKPDSNQVGALDVLFALPLFAGANGTSRHLLNKGRAVDLTNCTIVQVPKVQVPKDTRWRYTLLYPSQLDLNQF